MRAARVGQEPSGGGGVGIYVGRLDALPVSPTLPGTSLQAAAGCRSVGASALVERERGRDASPPGCMRAATRHQPSTPPALRRPISPPAAGVRPPAGLAVRRGDPAHGRAPATRRWRSPPAPLPPLPPPHPAMGAVAGGGSPPHFRWSSETARYKREAGVSGVKGPVTDVASPPLRVVDQTRVRPAYLPPPRVAHGVPTLHMHLRQRWSPAPPN